jgi:hypothetical protein
MQRMGITNGKSQMNTLECWLAVKKSETASRLPIPEVPHDRSSHLLILSIKRVVGKGRERFIKATQHASERGKMSTSAHLWGTDVSIKFK